MAEAPKRDARIGSGGRGLPLFSHDDFFLFDPEHPEVTPEQHLKARGGRMLDDDINANCGFCHKTMSMELFRLHFRGCAYRNFGTLDVIHKRFAGGAPNA